MIRSTTAAVSRRSVRRSTRERGFEILLGVCGEAGGAIVTASACQVDAALRAEAPPLWLSRLARINERPTLGVREVGAPFAPGVEAKLWRQFDQLCRH